MRRVLTILVINFVLMSPTLRAETWTLDLDAGSAIRRISITQNILTIFGADDISDLAFMAFKMHCRQTHCINEYEEAHSKLPPHDAEEGRHFHLYYPGNHVRITQLASLLYPVSHLLLLTIPQIDAIVASYEEVLPLAIERGGPSIRPQSFERTEFARPERNRASIVGFFEDDGDPIDSTDRCD